MADLGIDLADAGEGAEAAIDAGDHPLAADDIGKALDALGDQFGMLDIVRRAVDQPGDEDLVVGQA